MSCEVDMMLANLQLQEKSALTIDKLEEDYVLDISVQKVDTHDKVVAATSSNHTIRLLAYNDLAIKNTIKAHSNVITGVQFGHEEKDLIISSSLDKTVRCWDMRTDMKKPVQTLEGYEESDNVFTSFDLSCNDRVVCAGTEVEDSTAYIIFWDRRKSSVMGAYSESHQDDITQVCFHPNNHDKMATGSTDGLVCVFDLSEPSEDDALQLTLNTESSVGKVGWCGKQYKDVYCVTHIDTLHVWDTVNDGEDIKILTELKEDLKGSSSVEYLIDCIQTQDEPVVVAGTHSGDVRLVDVSGDPVVMTTLSGGHNSTVRVSHWDKQTKTLLTGGEDSFLCLWSKDGQTKQSPQKVKLKMKNSVSKKSRPY